MQIELVLHRATIEALLRQAAPIRIHLADHDRRRWIELDAPTQVEMVPKCGGVRVATSGRVHYDISELEPEAELPAVELLVEPRLVARADGLRLLLPLQIEGPNLERIPGLLDTHINSFVSAALRSSKERLMWRFGAGLTRELDLPDALDPLEALGIEPVDAELIISADAVTLRITVDSRVAGSGLEHLSDEASLLS